MEEEGEGGKRKEKKKRAHPCSFSFDWQRNIYTLEEDTRVFLTPEE